MATRVRRALDTVAVLLALDAGAVAVRAVTQRLPGRARRDTGAQHAASTAPGIEATSPSEIPARGWLQIAKRVYASIGQDRVMSEAASVTYFSLLAIFPALAALISLYGLIADPADIGKHMDAIAGVVPGGGVQIISDQIHALTTTPKKGLGIGVVIGLLTSLWSANAAVKSLFDALNAVYEERETRSYIHRTWLTLSFTLGALVFVILALTAVVVVPAVLHFVGLGAVGDLILSFGRWPVLLLGIMIFLSLVYRYGPSRAKARWRWVSWGSALAGMLWLLGSLAFSWYAANFGNYNKTYGSLGAAVGFMTWIWISTIIVLVGAELNAEMEHQTARDSTVGADKPMGQRGARRADTVAATST